MCVIFGGLGTRRVARCWFDLGPARLRSRIARGREGIERIKVLMLSAFPAAGLYRSPAEVLDRLEKISQEAWHKYIHGDGQSMLTTVTAFVREIANRRTPEDIEFLTFSDFFKQIGAAAAGMVRFTAGRNLLVGVAALRARLEYVRRGLAKKQHLNHEDVMDLNVFCPVLWPDGVVDAEEVTDLVIASMADTAKMNSAKSASSKGAPAFAAGAAVGREGDEEEFGSQASEVERGAGQGNRWLEDNLEAMFPVDMFFRAGEQLEAARAAEPQAAIPTNAPPGPCPLLPPPPLPASADVPSAPEPPPASLAVPSPASSAAVGAAPAASPKPPVRRKRASQGKASASDALAGGAEVDPAEAPVVAQTPQAKRARKGAKEPASGGKAALVAAPVAADPAAAAFEQQFKKAEAARAGDGAKKGRSGGAKQMALQKAARHSCSLGRFFAGGAATVA